MAIEKLPNVGESLFVVAKINELVDEVNKLQNHFHHARELQFGTEFPSYGTVKQLTPEDKEDDFA